MKEEKENPNFKLMHLRLLTKNNAADGEEKTVTESDILSLEVSSACKQIHLINL
jgi:hypothetical protein